MLFHTTALILFLAVITSSGGQEAECDTKTNANPEYKLKELILCNYDPTMLPVKNRNEKVTVTTRFFLRHIEFDEASNRLDAQMMLDLMWFDAFLKWDYRDFNLTQLQLSAHEVWVPDLTVFNNWDSWGSLSMEGQQVYVIWIGSVMYFNTIDLSSHCKLDITSWPYDVNVCTMSLSSATYFSNFVQFTLRGNWSFALEKEYTKNKVWDVVGLEASVKEQYFGSNNTYRMDTIELQITIARVSASLFTTVTTPMMVIVLTLMATFWTDPFDAYRMIFGMTSMIGHIFFLLHLGKVVPPSGDKPVLIVSQVRNSLILCWASLALNAYERVMCLSTKRPPVWMTNVLARLKRYKISACFFIPKANTSDAKTRQGEIEAFNTLEWLQVSAVMDKLCFMIYFCVYLAMLIEFYHHIHK